MYRQALPEEYNQLKDLWIESFSDYVYSIWYFNNLFDINSILIYEEDGRVLSMLHRMIFSFSDDSKYSYIYGACTAKKYQGRNIMTNLLLFCNDIDMKENLDGSFLVPENDSLFYFYNKRGYDKFIFNSNIDIIYNKEKICSNMNLTYQVITVSNENMELYDFCSIYNMCYKEHRYLIRDSIFYKLQISMFNSNNGHVYVITKNNNLLGYCFLYEDEIINVKEFICLDEDSKKFFIGYLLSKYNRDINISLFNSVLTNKYGCLKRYNDECLTDKLVANLLFD